MSNITRSGTVTNKPIVRMRADGWIIHNDTIPPSIPPNFAVQLEGPNGKTDIRHARPIHQTNFDAWCKHAGYGPIIKAYRIVPLR